MQEIAIYTGEKKITCLTFQTTCSFLQSEGERKYVNRLACLGETDTLFEWPHNQHARIDARTI